ncbi:MAG TPA: HD domain-containing phosphohydrolase [Thermoanaerobaculia bacterium]|jgi:hypothetical protein
MRRVHPEVDELRPKLKEILYDCAVEIRATKAALYLLDAQSRTFELITEYGFRGVIRTSADLNDPLIDRCMRGRNPFFVNGVGVEPKLAEILFQSSTERLLAAPLYSRGQLVGVIDMRDKAAKQAFEQTDLPKAQTIAERILALFANKNVFGQRFISLATEEAAPAPPQQQPLAAAAPPPQAPAAAPPVIATPPPVATPPASPTTTPPASPTMTPPGSPAMTPPASPAMTPHASPAMAPQLSPRTPPNASPNAPEPRGQVHVPRLATMIIDARNVANRIIVPTSQEAIGETEITVVRDALRAILLIPGVVTATFTAFGHMGGVQEIAARAALSDEAKNFLQSKLNVWLTKRGEGGGFLRTSITTPFGTSGNALTPADLQKVFTAALTVANVRGIYLTVAFSGTPDRHAHELLAVLHGHLQLALEHSMQKHAYVSQRMKIAESLLEPDFARYPALRRHTDAVAKLAEGFAHFLNLAPNDAEDARIVALVHDVGMRVLDYDRLYRKHDLSQDELGILREHVAVGAAMVEPLLGNDIARAVLCHHERVDGRGYPNGLHGEEIPYHSRLVQLCDSFVAITDPDTYQQPQPPENALAIIQHAAGGQFDAELATRFVEFVSRR